MVVLSPFVLAVQLGNTIDHLFTQKGVKSQSGGPASNKASVIEVQKAIERVQCPQPQRQVALGSVHNRLCTRSQGGLNAPPNR